ncbi:unnamed protein product (macronuclear) [Paramecium tetraurelia]|uniref:Uncharacterized protein n=1 Tax=Paramecium tetraurelia TaxID=5888 RepID=A0DDY4_PARTE|nr:uncharacterized protein GSPATT00016093001 [Paramecium tetraurelia]CAK81251.1 unnamed protein product [Paramecium tetraurelia]|eukprot:XP_001448648.1 hypothetical protein (macronuclear) [Paramecium tetraurelia strain d4-2]
MRGNENLRIVVLMKEELDDQRSLPQGYGCSTDSFGELESQAVYGIWL